MRVTIYFTGKVAGSLGRSTELIDRRTINVYGEFTMEEAEEAARQALYYPEKETDSPAYEAVSIQRLAFN